MELSIIIITYNEEKSIKKCLASLQNYLPASTNEVILVDNASIDNTVSIAEENFPEVKIIKNQSNRGVARARNQGIKNATEEYIMFLDADAELTPGAVKQLLTVMDQNPKIGIVGPKLVYPDGTPQYSARTFPTLTTVLWRGFGAIDKHPRLRQHLMIDKDEFRPQAVDWVMGACQLIRKKTIDDIGLLDEKYFFGYEDVDFCWRAWKMGWKVVYVPDAVAIHHYQRRSARGGIFNPWKWSHFFSAMRFLIKKNFS